MPQATGLCFLAKCRPQTGSLHGACAVLGPEAPCLEPALHTRGAPWGVRVRDTVQLAGWLCTCAHPSGSWRLTPRADPETGGPVAGQEAAGGARRAHSFLPVTAPLPGSHTIQVRAARPAASGASVSESNNARPAGPAGPGLTPAKRITSPRLPPGLGQALSAQMARLSIVN